MQIIFPQERQFGAAERTSCFMPAQLHFCDFEVNVGFVESSSARRADSRSVSSADAPLMATPPVTCTFCGAFLTFALTFIKSETSFPPTLLLLFCWAFCCMNCGVALLGIGVATLDTGAEDEGDDESTSLGGGPLPLPV